MFTNIINEFTYKQLIGKEAETPGITQRMKTQLTRYGTKFVKFFSSDGIFIFSTRSAYYDENHTVYIEKIQFANWKDIVKNADKVENLAKYATDIMRSEDIRISCSCPSFLYHGFAYITTSLDAKYGDPEHRAPDIRNPARKGSVCKHLSMVLRVLPFYASDLSKYLKSIRKATDAS